MTFRQKIQYILIALAWVFATLFFWNWWTSATIRGHWFLFLFTSLAIFYDITFLPAIFIFFLGKIKKPVASKKNNKGIRNVAMITLTVPGSEDIVIVERQLKALSLVNYPHDSWILVDNLHSPKIEELAEKYGVRYFCRVDSQKWGAKQVSDWNQAVPPFKGRTKSGNVNAWLDKYGDDYSHFTQLDIDHIPHKDYLDKVLGYFSDPQVGWVQAPSVYGNLSHWTARGSAEFELVLQGPLQMGFYGFCETPFIIGSHCTYDMRSVREIGGFQPTRAEDHLDTVYLAANGKKGVYLPEVIAVGDGPETFESYLSQQFAWAYSMIQVLLRFSPKLFPRLNLRQIFQFSFAQSWYPLWSLSMLTIFVSPLLSLLFDRPISHAGFIEFFLYSSPVFVMNLLVWLWSRKWQQPKGIFISWRGVVLHIARWVVVLSAFIQAVLNIQKSYMITAKGLKRERDVSLNLGTFGPYLLLFIGALVTSWIYLLRREESSVHGYLIFAIQDTLIVLLVLGVVLIKDLHLIYRESASLKRLMLSSHKPLMFLIFLSTLVIMTFLKSFDDISFAITGENLVTKKYKANRLVGNLEKPNMSETSALNNKEGSSKKSSSNSLVTYIVKPGDTLWEIASKYYNDGFKWKLITTKSGTSLIFPGEVLEIPNLELSSK